MFYLISTILHIAHGADLILHNAGICRRDISSTDFTLPLNFKEASGLKITPVLSRSAGALL